jgi:hypothetical protein
MSSVSLSRSERLSYNGLKINRLDAVSRAFTAKARGRAGKLKNVDKKGL